MQPKCINDEKKNDQGYDREYVSCSHREVSCFITPAINHLTPNKQEHLPLKSSVILYHDGGFLPFSWQGQLVRLKLSARSCLGGASNSFCSLFDRWTRATQSGVFGKFNLFRREIAALPHRLNAALERILPEKRLFLKTSTATRIINLPPTTQIAMFGGAALLVGWAIVSGALLAYEHVGEHITTPEHGAQSAYEVRLSALTAERDARAAEAQEAQARFVLALNQVSQYQSKLLTAQQEKYELEAGLSAVRRKLGTAMAYLPRDEKTSAAEKDLALQALNKQLIATAEARDAANKAAQLAKTEAKDAKAEQEQLVARNKEIFAQIEDAAVAAALPYKEMFAQLNLNTDGLMDSIEAEYSGQGGPLTQATVSTSGNTSISETEARASEIIVSLDQVNRYRIARDKLPLDMPVKSAFRLSSSFGARWGRMHNGIDMAAPKGTAVLVTADGVVKFAGRQNGYGNIIIVEHALGTETRYAHLSKIRVKTGQRVSHGSQIGDMGNTGRSTGPHLHYEVRVNNKPVNPMNFIKAAQNVY